jgi:hypothetical protein
MRYDYDFSFSAVQRKSLKKSSVNLSRRHLYAKIVSYTTRLLKFNLHSSNEKKMLKSYANKPTLPNFIAIYFLQNAYKMYV